jgi:uncharacterized protein (TIGR00106 family)
MVVAEFSIVPLGKGESMSRWVARMTRIIRRSGLPDQLTPMGTVVEGSLDDVFRLVRSCVRALERDCRRLSVSLKADVRRGRTPRMIHKVHVVEALVAGRGSRRA